MVVQEELSQFQERFVNFAKTMVRKAEAQRNRELSEEDTKQYYILPFLRFLGWDDADEEEVQYEVSAGKAEKYKDRVDIAIFITGQPVMAIECKKLGVKDLGDERGQLHNYFHALLSVKLGVLTNGQQYDFYADSDYPNVMDDKPFLTLDLAQVARGKLEQNLVYSLCNFQKGKFNPESIGATARKSLALKGFAQLILNWSETADDDDLVRLMVKKSGIATDVGKISSKMVESYKETVVEAFRNCMAYRFLDGIGFKDATGITLEAKEPPKPAVVIELPTAKEESSSVTATELSIFEHVKLRLAWLIKDKSDETLFSTIQEIAYRDFKNHFKVFWRQERLGALFIFTEGRKGSLHFEFPALGNKEIVIQQCNQESLMELDAALLESFLKRVNGDRSGDVEIAQGGE